MAHDLKIGNQILEGVEKIEVANTLGDLLSFELPTGEVPTSSQQWATGFKDCTAGESFRVEGLSFKPKGYAFMLCGNITSNSNIGDSTNCLLSCFYDVEKKLMRRVVGTNSNYTVRVNPSESSGAVFVGGFEQTASTSSQIYNVMGERYFWIAWG